jgi:hypothetical protein
MSKIIKMVRKETYRDIVFKISVDLDKKIDQCFDASGSDIRKWKEVSLIFYNVGISDRESFMEINDENILNLISDAKRSIDQMLDGYDRVIVDKLEELGFNIA